MAQVTQLRYATALKQLLGLRVSDPGRVVAAALAPTLEVQDTYRPETRLSRGERSFGIGINVTNATGANFSSTVLYQLQNSNRLTVLKRVTLSLNLPTATVAPGNVYFGILRPASSGFGAVNPATPKDARVSVGLSQTVLSTNIFTVGGLTASAPPNTTGVYVCLFFPGAATVPTIHQVDNLDIVITPGTQVTLQFASDTNTVAPGYSYNVFCEGYERALDPSELLAAPP